MKNFMNLSPSFGHPNIKTSILSTLEMNKAQRNTYVYLRAHTCPANRYEISKPRAISELPIPCPKVMKMKFVRYYVTISYG